MRAHRQIPGTTNPRVERVLWVSPNCESLVLIPVYDHKALPRFVETREIQSEIQRADCRVIELDPFAELQKPEELIPEMHRLRRDRAFKVLEPLLALPMPELFKPEVRGPIVRRIHCGSAISKRTIYFELRRFLQAGMRKNALLPRYDRCGGRGKERACSDRKRGRPSAVRLSTNLGQGVNVDPDIRDKFRRGIKAFYENSKSSGKHTFVEAYQLTLQNYFHKGYRMQNGVRIPVLPPVDELPTFRQFRYWYQKERDPSRALIAREGERRFNLRRRAILGDSTQMAFGPGSIFQIDATTADLYLVSSLDRKRIVGLPTLYLCVDVFSRLITGFAALIQPPSYLAAALALENAASDKQEYCKGIGLTISPDDWPCQHLPECLVADRGELEGPMADNIVNSLHVRLSNTAPYRADWKAIVERSFRTVNDQMLHWMPGAVDKNYERGQRDYRLDAVLDLREFRQLMVCFILEHNRRRIEGYRLDQYMIGDQLEPRPSVLWNWGIRNRSGHLRTMDPDTLRRNLLPRDQATVTARGIRFQGLFYVCERALTEQWFVKARERGTWKVDVAYDPRDVETLFLCVKGVPRPETCQLVAAEERFKGRPWIDVEDHFRSQDQGKELAATSDQQATAEFRARIESIVSQAQENTAAARDGRQSKRARIKGIRANRQAERAHDEAQSILRDKETIVPLPTPVHQGQTNADSYVPPASPLDQLKLLRDRQWEES